MDTKCLILDDDELGKISWRDGTKNTETLFKSKPNNFPFTPVNQPREKIINDIFYKKNILKVSKVSKVSKVINEINN